MLSVNYSPSDNLLIPKKYNFHILHINARSMRHKLDFIEILLHRFPKKPDAVVVSKSWLREGEESLFNLNGYSAYHSVRKDKEGGGVSVFINSDFQSTLILNLSFGVCNALIVNLPKLKLKICGCYRPLNPEDQNDFGFFNDSFDDILQSNTGMIVLGDMNVNLLNVDRQSSLYSNTVASNGFAFMNKISKKYATRVKDSSHTIIDHVLTDTTLTTILRYLTRILAIIKALLLVLK